MPCWRTRTPYLRPWLKMRAFYESILRCGTVLHKTNLLIVMLLNICARNKKTFVHRVRTKCCVIIHNSSEVLWWCFFQQFRVHGLCLGNIKSHTGDTYTSSFHWKHTCYMRLNFVKANRNFQSPKFYLAQFIKETRPIRQESDGIMRIGHLVKVLHECNMACSHV